MVVDYAHTDDALRNLTALGRELVSGAKGRVLTVFGCGGDRDRKKRPLMGEAAGRGSDFVVLTSDNPRSEDPLAIINDAVVGLQKTGVKYSVEPDRRKAIALAIGEARPGDIVLLAGRGMRRCRLGGRVRFRLMIWKWRGRRCGLRGLSARRWPERRDEADAFQDRRVCFRCEGVCS